jgi:Tfp pilus assembly protein PilF
MVFGMLNTAGSVLAVAESCLDAEIAMGKKDWESAISQFRKAVQAEDALRYDEPPAWLNPVRESLGGALLRSGKAAEAERVFRDDLKKNLRNGRSLFGLLESLKAQGKLADAKAVELQFQTAWKSADTQLRIEDL